MKIREWLLGIFGLKNKEKPPEESVKEEVLLLAYEPEEFHLESEELPVKKPIQTEFSFIRKTQPTKRPIRKNPMTPRTLPPILQVAKEIMQTNKAVMHVREITEIAVSQNKNLGLPPEEFMSKLSSALAAHLKTQNPIFSKPTNKDGSKRKGIYRLKRTASAPVVPIPKVTVENVSTNFFGKGGEFAVASELLFLGYNVSMMAVDEGVDLITEKDGKFNYVQVKTTVVEEGTHSFSFKVPEKQFTNNLPYSPYYVFVMRDGHHSSYAVLPSDHLSLLRAQQIIKGKDLSIVITRDARRREYKLNGQDINIFIGAFNKI